MTELTMEGPVVGRARKAFNIVDDWFVQTLDDLLGQADVLMQPGYPGLKQNRTGVKTVSMFGNQYRFNLENGENFPLLSVKKTHWKSIVHELIWFLRGETTLEYLHAHGVTIWDEWAKDGKLGPIYGKQWRAWEDTRVFNDQEDPREFVEGGYRKVAFDDTQHEVVGLVTGTREIDQLAQAIHLIKTDPDNRRIIVTAWNPAEIPKMALAPCHCFFQFNVDGDFLDMQMYQRSADLFLGVPFNVASYSLLLLIVARITGKKARHFVHTFGDLHLYETHFAEARKLVRDYYALSTEDYVNDHKVKCDVRGVLVDAADVTFEDVFLSNYSPWPSVKVEVAV